MILTEAGAAAAAVEAALFVMLLLALLGVVAMVASSGRRRHDVHVHFDPTQAPTPPEPMTPAVEWQSESVRAINPIPAPSPISPPLNRRALPAAPVTISQLKPDPARTPEPYRMAAKGPVRKALTRAQRALPKDRS